VHALQAAGCSRIACIAFGSSLLASHRHFSASLWNAGRARAPSRCGHRSRLLLALSALHGNVSLVYCVFARRPRAPNEASPGSHGKQPGPALWPAQQAGWGMSRLRCSLQYIQPCSHAAFCSSGAVPPVPACCLLLLPTPCLLTCQATCHVIFLVPSTPSCTAVPPPSAAVLHTHSGQR
jgi:hypothetical protein